MSPSRIVAGALAVACVLAGCRFEGKTAPTPLPHVDVPKDPMYPEAVAAAHPWFASLASGDVPVAAHIDEFIKRLAAIEQAKEKSFACLPLVNYDVRRGRPWISELGVRFAEEVSDRSRTTNALKQVLTNGEIVERLRATEVEKRLFSTYDNALALAPALGVEVVAFGALRREYDVGKPGRNLITAELVAFDVNTGLELVKIRFEVASDVELNAPFYGLAERESTWLVRG